MQIIQKIVNIKKKLIFILIFLFVFVYPKDKQFVVVIPSYNNEKFCIKNLDSVFNQNYTNFRVIYIDDCSSDNTYKLVKYYINKNKRESKILLISNKNKQGAMANHYKAAHLCNAKEIIVHLDGDDWFENENVLSYLNEIYQDPDIWLTYGQYSVYSKKVIKSCCKGLPNWVINNNAYRDYPFVTSHLRTFYAALFHKINLKDFFYKGKFLPISCDVGFMMPMLEMAGNHAKFIDKILYVYNAMNPIMDYKTNKPILDLISYYIRDKKPYKRLKKLEFQHNQVFDIDIIVLNLMNKDDLNKKLSQIKQFIKGYRNIIIVNKNNLYKKLTFHSDYVLLTSDVIHINADSDLRKAAFHLERTNALAFFFSNTLQNEDIMNFIDEGIMACQFKYNSFNKYLSPWNMILIKSSKLKNLFYLEYKAKDIALYYEKAIAKIQIAL